MMEDQILAKATSQIRVFIDTNCFLHLRDLKDLPWTDIFPGARAVDVYVSPVVIDELDRLKTEKSGRIRDRCRAALQLIESASTQPDMKLSLRKKPISLRLAIAQGSKTEWERFPKLDSQRADDQLVASAVSEPGDEPTSLLSFDTGPLIRARLLGFSAMKTPDAWMLPPQQDPLEKEKNRLARDLAIARAARPALEARWVDQAADGTIHAIVPTLPDLTPEQQERLLKRLKLDNPRSGVVADRDPYGLRIGIGGISQHSVDRYRKEYDTFIRRSKALFAKLPAVVAASLELPELQIEIENVSEFTAERLRVSIEAMDDSALLFGSKSDLRKVDAGIPKLKAPEPPSDPLYSMHRNLVGAFKEDRDPTGFYWFDRPMAASTGVLTCEEFRPSQSELLSVFAGLRERSGHLTVEVHARNLAAPIRLPTVVSASTVQTDWSHPSVVARLPTWMAEEIVGE